MDELKIVAALDDINRQIAWLETTVGTGQITEADYKEARAMLDRKKEKLADTAVPKLVYTPDASAPKTSITLKVTGFERVWTKEMLDDGVYSSKALSDEIYKRLLEQSVKMDRQYLGNFMGYPAYSSEPGTRWPNLDRAMGGVDPAATVDRAVITGPLGNNAAEMLWRDYSGVVLCECDDADCAAVLEISHDEYIHASGSGGYYRITAPTCAHGVLGASLITREPRWHVWTKVA